MQPDLQTTDTSLTITRTFRATPEELWELWTDPEKISEWHRPGPEYTVKHEGEAQVGGKYELNMTDHRGTQTAFGEFQVVEPPRKLVYSWSWRNSPFKEDSRVTILLEPVDAGTKLTLVHDRLSSPESVRAHAQGWMGIMGNLESLTS